MMFILGVSLMIGGQIANFQGGQLLAKARAIGLPIMILGGIMITAGLLIFLR